MSALARKGNFMEVKKIVNKDKKYTAKNGKEYCSTNYYLVLDNGKYIPIRCAFGKDYALLDCVAKVIVNG